MKRPLVDISIIEKNMDGRCRPALLRRATFRALGLGDQQDSALFQAMRDAGVADIPPTNSETLFANAHNNRKWAEAIATLLGTTIHAIWPNCFVRISKTRPTAPKSKVLRTPLRSRPTMLSNAALEMLEQKIRDRGGFAAVAKASGLSKKTLENMMRGFGSPHFLTVASACVTLGVSLDTFAASCGIARGGKL